MVSRGRHAAIWRAQRRPAAQLVGSRHFRETTAPPSDVPVDRPHPSGTSWFPTLDVFACLCVAGGH